MSLPVVLVGAGDWARTALAPAVRSIPGAEIVACVDPDTDRAQALADEFGAPVVAAELAAVPNSARPAVVVISSPDRHHPAAVEQALDLGAAVYCEKPLAASGAEAHRLVTVAEAVRTPSTVGFNFRYSEAIQRLRTDLLDGTLGTPWLIETLERNSQFHPTAGRPMTWKGDPAHAPGGALVEYGAHVLDLAQWLGGPITDVMSQLSRVAARSQLDDVATLQLRHRSGALGTLATGWVLAGGYPGIRVVVHASEGTGEVLIDSARTPAETYRRYDLSGAPVTRVEAAPVPRHGYARRHLADLLARVAGGSPEYANTLPTVRDAASVQRVLDAALDDDPASGAQRTRPVTQS